MSEERVAPTGDKGDDPPRDYLYRLTSARPRKEPATSMKGGVVATTPSKLRKVKKYG